MRNDIKSNTLFAVGIAATSQVANTYNGASVDHSKGSSAVFFINAGTFGTNATLDAKLQYSNDGTNWTDYSSSDGTGNSGAMTQMTAAGSSQLSVVVPLGRYSRCVATVAVAAVVYGITNVVGPLRSVVPA